MSNSTLTHKQASLLFRMTGLKFWEPGQRPEPSISQASAIIDRCFHYLETKEDSDLRAVWALVAPFFPDWQGNVRRPFFGGHKSQNGQGHFNLGGGSAEPSGAAGAAAGAAEPSGAAGAAACAAEPSGAAGAAAGAAEPSGAASAAAGVAEPSSAASAAAGAAEPSSSAGHSEKVKKFKAAKNERTKKTAVAVVPDSTLETLQARIGAGLRNFWLVGPAGTGKTTLCRELAVALDLPCTILSCSAGTSPAEITGFKYPEPRASAISRAIGQPGIVVFDEITMLESDVAAVCNALLANNEIETSTGHVVRDEMCIIIATANTVGLGANRMYCGNNQLDASTLDRFVGGFIDVSYSAAYEDRFDSEVVTFCRAARDIIKNNRLERIVSTRAVIAASKLKAAGLSWKEEILSSWSVDEKALLRAGGVL